MMTSSLKVQKDLKVWKLRIKVSLLSLQIVLLKKYQKVLKSEQYCKKYQDWRLKWKQTPFQCNYKTNLLNNLHTKQYYLLILIDYSCELIHWHQSNLQVLFLIQIEPQFRSFVIQPTCKPVKVCARVCDKLQQISSHKHPCDVTNNEFNTVEHLKHVKAQVVYCFNIFYAKKTVRSYLNSLNKVAACICFYEFE